jgi:transposase
MPKTSPSIAPTAALDYESTLVVVVEISKKSWVIGAQIPGFPQSKSKQKIAAQADALAVAIDGYKRRAEAVGKTIERVVVAYEAGYSGFWLARWLQRRGVEVYVIQPSSVPVERTARRAKTDAIDVDLLLRTLLAWLRGEPRVCSMVPIPDAGDEDARRPMRERADLVAERIAVTNRIGSILATFGIDDYTPLRGDRRERLDQLRSALGEPLPPHACAQIGRLLDRLELVLKQIAIVEQQRDAAVQADSTGRAESMIALLMGLKGIGVQLATILVWEGFVREFRNGKALGAYAGLTGTPYDSGGRQREQGISRAGNARLRCAMVELAWLWQRHQPNSALTRWLHGRLGHSKGRLRRVLTVALARKLLIALWRFATDGIVPEGAELKAV